MSFAREIVTMVFVETEESADLGPGLSAGAGAE